MGTLHARGSEVRRNQIRTSRQPINGLDYLELFPPARPGDAGAYLLVYLLRPEGVGSIRPGLVAIRGGARVTHVAVQGTAVATRLLPGLGSTEEWASLGWTPEDAAALAEYFRGRGQLEADPSSASFIPSRVLVVRAWPRGDLAPYTLFITSPPGLALDRQLQSVDFSFHASGESELDPGVPASEASPRADEPEIDYLAKDFASFRRLMLDRMSTLLPDWVERSSADLGVTLVEALAAAGDSLSYFQDAVASEAYLGTARQRISVRRHARLLDTLVHDGCNARTFAVLEVGSGEGDPPLYLGPRQDVVVQLLTAVPTFPTAATHDQVDPSLVTGAEVFEPLHNALLRREHNAIPFYTWGEETRSLPRGSTAATLRNHRGHLPDGGLTLAPGDLLLLEEVRDPESGEEAEARPDHRQIVRLTSVTYTSDPLYDEETGAPYPGATANPNPLQVVEVGWSDAEALVFDLTLGGSPPVSVARGNVVLVDHGRSVIPDEPLEVGDDPDLRPPRLKQLQVTQQGRVRNSQGTLVPVDPGAPASRALAWEMRDVQPSVALSEQHPPRQTWVPRRDLLGSDRFAAELVVEVDDAERAWIRFGDDIKGRRPLRGTRFAARYRVGNGSRGNISAEALRHVLFTPRSGVGDAGAGVHTHAAKGILRVRNPLPAVGGREPESIDEVRLLAPSAFRVQARAVTEDDYAAIAARHPEVRKAAAAFRWTGGWHTAFVYVERASGEPVDDGFRARLGAFLERYRMARHDVRIEGPRSVPLDIAFTVHVDGLYLRSAVRKALLEAFSNTVLPGGALGFFHPARWTFGQPVLLSPLVAAAMAVPGVRWVDFTGSRFQRWGAPPGDELARGLIPIGPTEIARLDNDADSPESGRLELLMQGGM